LAGTWSGDGNNENHPQPRAGGLLNYSPLRDLDVREALSNSIAVIGLTDHSVVFHVRSVNHIYSAALPEPTALAPVTMVPSNPYWASNTTLDVECVFYVANRGDNTITRMRQDGAVVAMRRVRMNGGQPLGALQLNGIATSPNGSRIWVTLSGPVPGMGEVKGAVLELPTF